MQNQWTYMSLIRNQCTDRSASYDRGHVIDPIPANTYIVIDPIPAKVYIDPIYDSGHIYSIYKGIRNKNTHILIRFQQTSGLYTIYKGIRTSKPVDIDPFQQTHILIPFQQTGGHICTIYKGIRTSTHIY